MASLTTKAKKAATTMYKAGGKTVTKKTNKSNKTVKATTSNKNAAVIKKRLTTTKKTTTPKAPTLATAKLTTPKFTSVAYDEKKYRKGIDTSYYDKAKATYKTQAEKDRASQIGEARATQQNALKQAYVTSVQNQNRMTDSMAAAGIRGGASETAMMGIANQYASDRTAADTNYSSAVNSINQAVDKNIADYNADMDSRAEEYRQNVAQAKWNAAREDANNKWNAARDDAITRFNAANDANVARYNAANTRYNNWVNYQRENAQTKRNQAIEYYYNYYQSMYSGVSTKTLDKEYKATQKALKKKGLSATERIRLEQKLRGIQDRRGVIANKK